MPSIRTDGLAKCLTVKSLISFNQGVMTCKILLDLCRENLRHKFTERSMVSENRTRSRRDLEIPKVMLEYAKRSFYFSGVKNWKDIPDNSRKKESIARLTIGFREYILNLSQDPNTTPWYSSNLWLCLILFFLFLNRYC